MDDVDNSHISLNYAMNICVLSLCSAYIRPTLEFFNTVVVYENGALNQATLYGATFIEGTCYMAFTCDAGNLGCLWSTCVITPSKRQAQ